MSFLQVSRKVDYALRAVIHLANEEANDRACSVAEIAARERIPRQFLEKIVQHLIHTGLVRSRRGPRGGYVLGAAGPADDLPGRDRGGRRARSRSTSAWASTRTASSWARAA